jgi:hypothetical protein
MELGANDLGRPLAFALTKRDIMRETDIYAPRFRSSSVNVYVLNADVQASNGCRFVVHEMCGVRSSALSM